MCSSVPEFHATMKCDYNPLFYKRNKKRPLQVLVKNQDYQMVFTDL